MPSRITELSETQIIADLLHDLRRQARATAAAQEPIWTYDTFTISGSGDTTHTLSYVPYGINVTLLNGLGLTEGTDYTADYTTGIVTVSATLAAGDVLHIRYVTNGDLVAYSGPVDVGDIFDNFNRANSTTGLGGTVPWQYTAPDIAANRSSVWGITSNQADLVSTASGNGGIAYVTASSPYGTADIDLNNSGLPADPGYVVWMCFDAEATPHVFRCLIITRVHLLELYVDSGGSGGTNIMRTWATGGTVTSHLNAVLSAGQIVVTVDSNTPETITGITAPTSNRIGMFIQTGNTSRLDNFSFQPA